MGFEVISLLTSPSLMLLLLQTDYLVELRSADTSRLVRYDFSHVAEDERCKSTQKNYRGHARRIFLLVPLTDYTTLFDFETAPNKTSLSSARGSAACRFEPRFFLSNFRSPFGERNAIFSFPKPSSGCSCSSSALYPLELKLGALLLARPHFPPPPVETC